MARGTVRVRWDPSAAQAALDEGGKDGFEAATAFVLQLANEHVPYDTGHLAGTGQVDWSKDGGTVYYDTPYAVKLHEDRRLHIKNGREGRWLTKSAQKSRPSLLGILAEGLRTRFRGGKSVAQ